MDKAVIFDIDGTLIDSVDPNTWAWRDALRDFGHDVGFEEIRGQIGKGGDQLMPVFLDPAELHERGPALEEHRGRIFRNRYLPGIAAFPDVRALFQRLCDDGIRIGLASSAKEEEVEVYKKIADIDGLVDVATSSADAEKSKPHPDIFQAALARLGLPPAAVLVVGDTPWDVQAAQACGLRAVAVLCGGFPEADLRRAGCIAVYQDPADMLRQYESFRRMI